MAGKLVTPEEAARTLSISSKTIRQWLRTGRLKGVKAGRLWRVREEDINTFLQLPEGEASHRQPRRYSAFGMLSGSPRSVEDFLREKHEETEREEQRHREEIA